MQSFYEVEARQRARELELLSDCIKPARGEIIMAANIHTINEWIENRNKARMEARAIHDKSVAEKRRSDRRGKVHV